MISPIDINRYFYGYPKEKRLKGWIGGTIQLSPKLMFRLGVHLKW